MSNLPECETKPSNKVTVKPPSPMGVPMTDQQRCSPTPQGNDSNVLPKHTDISSSDQRPGCSTHPHLLSQLLLLQCPQPFLLPVLSSSAFFFSPCTLLLSPLCFSAFDKCCPTSLTTALLRLCPLVAAQPGGTGLLLEVRHCSRSGRPAAREWRLPFLRRPALW